MASGNWDLPADVREIAWIIGREKALYLAGHVLKWGQGGHRGKSACLYIPKRLKPNHRLVQILGWNDAAALCFEFAGLILQISSCSAVIQRWRNDEIRRLAAAGLTAQSIAPIMGISDRYVRAIRAA